MRQIHQENLEFWRFVLYCTATVTAMVFVSARVQAPPPRVRSVVQSCLHVRAFGEAGLFQFVSDLNAKISIQRVWEFLTPFNKRYRGIYPGYDYFYPEAVRCAMTQADDAGR